MTSRIKTKFNALNNGALKNLFGGTSPCPQVCDNTILTTCCQKIVVTPDSKD
jgi:hypothetical protein